MRRWLQSSVNTYHNNSNDSSSVLASYYRFNLNSSNNLSSKFVSLHPDEETLKFLHSCYEASLLYLFVETLLVRFFRIFMSLTDTNAWLGRGEMFVASTQQFQTLLEMAQQKPVDGATCVRVQSMVDIGAGDGHVTEQLKPLVAETIHTTEVSDQMVLRLQQRGFK